MQKTVNNTTTKRMASKTALQQFIEWGDEMIEKRSGKHLSFYEAIDKAEELLSVEKQQIMKAVYDSMGTNFDPNMGRAEMYYNENYGK